MIFTFPLDYTNDYSSHMASLFFLFKCGFHNFCSYWYNGFVVLKTYPPGWFFFTYPLYLITKNVQLSTYLSILILFGLCFIVIYLLSKIIRISKIKAIAFFDFINLKDISNFKISCKVKI